MTYIDVTDDYDETRPGMYEGGDIEPDAQDYATNSNYCEHGNYIGNPWGADHICGYCEDGVTAEEFRQIVEERERRGIAEFEAIEGIKLLGRMTKRIKRIENLQEDFKGYLDDKEWSDFFVLIYNKAMEDMKERGAF